MSIFCPQISKQLLSKRPVNLVGCAQELAVTLFLHETSNLPHLILCKNRETAKKIQESLPFFYPHKEIFLLEHFDVDIYSEQYPDKKATWNKLYWLYKASKAQPHQIFISYTEALLQLTLEKRFLETHSHFLKKGSVLPKNFERTLSYLGYSQRPLIKSPGEYSFRRNLIDVYSPSLEKPLRIELFGDSVESLRIFNPEDQKSIEPLSEAHVIPAREVLYLKENQSYLYSKFQDHFKKKKMEGRKLQELLFQINHQKFFTGIEFFSSFFYKNPSLPTDFFQIPLNVWWIHESSIQEKSKDTLEILTKQSEETPIFRPFPRDIFSSSDKVVFPEKSLIHKISDLELQSGKKDFKTLRISPIISLRSSPSKYKDYLFFLKNKLESWKKEGYQIFVSCPSRLQKSHVQQILKQIDLSAEECSPDNYSWSNLLKGQGSIFLIPRFLSDSLILGDEKVVFLTSSFFTKKAVHKSSSSSLLSRNLTEISFSTLKEGDYIVHKLYGIGSYEGLKLLNVNGVDSEFLCLKYKDGDILYVPIHKMSSIQKYIGKKREELIQKLGTQHWVRTKLKVKKNLQDITASLLHLYAQRASLKKVPLPIVDSAYLEFERTFEYEETPDQTKAMEDILGDLSSPKIMDRLLCGDVGFGKTEIAMRTSFKVVQEGLQVAVIAPTTVLSFQLFRKFTERFENWPICIKLLNRFTSKPDSLRALEELKNGKINIIIGTHKLLGADVLFSKLGLLIVDEEHRFGVKHKEQIKKKKASVDSLALSATPIPRTLSMSLLGLRDISLMQTPPDGRVPVKTFLCHYKKDFVRKAILQEINRKGQVFFVHNRVEDIYSKEAELKELVPEVSINVAHGQMDKHNLESVIMSFVKGKTQLLVCTTLIESGTDIPRANTIFISSLHSLGLSQIYQLRGRVGRSHVQGYCYLLIPENCDDKMKEKLSLVANSSSLRGGLQIAQYDLELRGAGDLLGENQSGHMNSIGHHLYLELLKESIREAKGETSEEFIDPDINLKISFFIPDTYIKDIKTRLYYYKVLSYLETPREVDQIKSELIDIFGPLPQQVLSLLEISLIKKACKDLRITDISEGNQFLFIRIDKNSPIQTNALLNLVQKNPTRYKLTQKNFAISMDCFSLEEILKELKILKTLTKVQI